MTMNTYTANVGGPKNRRVGPKAQSLPIDAAPVPLAPGYWVTPCGCVWSSRFKRRCDDHLKFRQMTPVLDQGYPSVTLRYNGKKSYRRVHRLVLEAFVGPRPSGCVACHGDGNRENNRLDNLRWDTYRENVMDTRRHGRERHLAGVDHSNAKLTPEAVRDIRLGVTTRQESMRALARRYGVNLQTVRLVVAFKTWAHVQDQ